MIVIRKASAPDAELIADLSRSTFYETFASQNKKEDLDKFLNEQFTRESLIREVTTPGNIFFIAEINGEPQGYVRLRERNTPPGLEEKTALELARIYVRQACVGKGIGKILMLKCFEVAEELGCDVLWLGVWEENHRALKFYESFGFVKFAKHTFWLGNDPQDDWLMSAPVPLIKK